LGGCGNIHSKNLSDDFLVRRTARTLKVAPELITLSNRCGLGTTGIDFDISIKNDPQHYHCSIWISDYLNLGWTLSPVSCGCYVQQDDDQTIITYCTEGQ